MRRHHLLHLLLPLLLAAVAAASQAEPDPRASAAAAPVSPAAAAQFVRRSCRATGYPRVCESTLLPCAPAVGRSPRRLGRAALVVGADRAGNCSAYPRAGGGAAPSASRGSRGGGAMKDCRELLGDAEDRLRQSAAEMDRMGRAGSPRFAWCLSNVQTWASAALTDTSTCLDSLGAGKDAVMRRVLAVAQAISNALALVNKLDPAPHRL